ncbi:Alpha/Beta hydrolase protein, partial [Mycena olivaceomarginata]
MWSLLLTAFTLSLGLTAATQVSLSDSLHLSSVRSDDFTTLSHSRFPNHRVRVKQSSFVTPLSGSCMSFALTSFTEPGESVYTGYLDVDQGAKHLFFYFFESRRDPAKDDVVMWINGGPGCSSSTGLLMELGEFARAASTLKTASSNGTTWNPHSWNSEANIFFLDQPQVDACLFPHLHKPFSYADFGETIETTEDAAKNVYAFISLFFEAFPQFAGRALHLSGESYGGRYLPVFASEIYDQNQLAIAQGRQTLNLQSVIIGNGITDISTTLLSLSFIRCTPAAYDIECGIAALELPRCQKLMQASCIDQFDANQLPTAVITKYLSDPVVQELLGVDPQAANFSSCSDDVSNQFIAHLDKWAVPTQYYVASPTGSWNSRPHLCWNLRLEMHWVANRFVGRQARLDKAGGGSLLSFVTIRGAGHMIKALAMLSA